MAEKTGKYPYLLTGGESSALSKYLRPLLARMKAENPVPKSSVPTLTQTQEDSK